MCTYIAIYLQYSVLYSIICVYEDMLLSLCVYLGSLYVLDCVVENVTVLDDSHTVYSVWTLQKSVEK